ncbi:MAG: sugar phosphate isomerase/epimerase [Fusicatenibacter sp.]|nr:sugar phosphate isomerase/epimerase [Lachnospiraceae bacterium]MDY2936985.1 sugar phosphate isomerase/epimerase [Fusicatenibacter sp.]
MKIGAQFFTVRDFCKDLDSFSESLQKVAEIGYDTVQISGTCQYDPLWLKEELDKNGLQCVLTHIPAERLQKETEKVAADHDVFGCRYVGLGSFKFDEEQEGTHYEDFLRLYKPVAKTLKEHGKYFMYHNHSQEFKKYKGRIILESLAEDMALDEMGFTVDTFWVQAGGGDPAQWIEKLSGRVPCIHLKDYAYGTKMAAIGDGNINFDRVFEKALDAGTEYMLVEQDDCNGEDPFVCLKRSYDYLRARGFK